MLKKKEKRVTDSLRVVAVLFSLALAFAFWQEQSLTAFAQGTAKVKVEGGLIRETADKSSTALGSVKRDDVLDVVASTTDTDGYTWYRVFVNRNSQGYIRSDLVTVEGTVSAEKPGNSNLVASAGGGNTTTVGSGGNRTTVGSNNSTPAAEGDGTDSNTQSTTTAGVMESSVVSARVTEKVRVRSGPGTGYDVAGSAEDNTEVTVSGEAVDGEDANRRWYQVSFTAEGKTINGFIRSDYLEVVQTAPQEPAVEEPAQEEPPVEETPVNDDYYLKYMENENGEWDWYLFDNIQGTSVSLTQLLSAVAQNQETEETENKQLSNMKIIVIVMAVVLVLLLVAVTVLFFKLHESYDDYDDEDDEEEEEDDEDDTPIRALGSRARRKEVRRSVFSRRKEEDEEEEDEDEEEDPPVRARTKVPAKTANKKDSSEENKSWQSKDFLELDDDMEFEFLDL